MSTNSILLHNSILLGKECNRFYFISLFNYSLTFYTSQLTVSPQAAAETGLTCRCQAAPQTSSVVASAPHCHERNADGQLSVSQAGSQPEIMFQHVARL